MKGTERQVSGRRHSINEGDDPSSHAAAGCGDGRKQGAVSPRAKGKMRSNATKMLGTCFCISITMAQWRPVSVRLWASVSVLSDSNSTSRSRPVYILVVKALKGSSPVPKCLTGDIEP
jgi:hypothetical protein